MRFRSFLITVILFLSILFINLQLRGLDVAWVEPADETQRKWDPKLFRVVSFGYLPAAIDTLWVNTLFDQAIDHVPQGVHPKLYFNLDLVTELDPAFYLAYYGGANLLAVIRNDGAGARDLLLKAKKFRDQKLESYSDRFKNHQWKYPWQISLLLAYVYLWELKDMPHAAIEFQDAAQYPGGPEYLQRLSKRFQAEGGVYEVSLKLLESMIGQTQDQRVLEKLKLQYQSVLVAQFIFWINKKFNENFKKYSNPSSSAVPTALDFINWMQAEKNSYTNLYKDPWGGDLRFEGGKIVTSTPYEKVFGLE